MIAIDIAASQEIYLTGILTMSFDLGYVEVEHIPRTTFTEYSVLLTTA